MGNGYSAGVYCIISLSGGREGARDHVLASPKLDGLEKVQDSLPNFTNQLYDELKE